MKNIKNLWSIICRSSSIDRDTNIISLFDVVEEITVTTDLNSNGVKDLEVIQLPIEFVTMWQRYGDIQKELEVSIKLVAISPKGKETVIGPTKFTFEKEKPRMRLRIKVNGIVFNGFGSYKFKIMMEEKNEYVEVQEIPLDIKASVKV